MSLDTSICCTVVRSLGDLQRLEVSWNSLWESDPQATVFQGFDWVSTWLEHYQHLVAEIFVVAVHRNDELLALAPLYVRTADILPPREPRLLFTGTGEDEQEEAYAEYMAPLYRSVDALLRAQCEDLMVDCIVRECSVASAEFCRVRPELVRSFADKLAARWEGRASERWAGQCFRMAVGAELAMGALSSRSRSSHRRKLRRLRSQEGFTFDVARSESERQGFFKSLVALHTQHWESRGKPGVFSNPVFLAFHDALSKKLLERGHLLLARLRTDGEDMGAVYVLGDERIQHYYQSGIDLTRHGGLSPGIAMHFLAADEVADRGGQCYDLMLSSRNGYKGRIGQPFEDLVYLSTKGSMLNRIRCLFGAWLGLSSQYTRSIA